MERERASTLDKGHGRQERRTITTTTVLNQHLRWPGVRQVCQIRRERKIGARVEIETAYFVTSLARHRANAQQLLALARQHWGAIENGVHYIRDEAFGEDRCTIFRGHAPQNLTALRNAALNWLRQTGHDKITSTLRSFARYPLRLFAKLGYTN